MKARAKGGAASSVSHHGMKFFRIFIAFGLVLVACGSRLPPEANAPLPRASPPPMPGDSIAASQMCSCKACVEGGCCFDAREPGGSSCASNAVGYDFTAASNCGLEVQTCTSRCYERVWRVPNERDCSEKKPADCCS